MCAFLTSFNIKLSRKLVMHGMQLGIKKQRSEFETDWPKFMETIIVMFLVVSTV